MARGGKPRKNILQQKLFLSFFRSFFFPTKVNKYTKAGRLSPNRIT